MPDPFISRQDLTDYLGRDLTTDDGALIAVDSACEIVRTTTEQTFNRGTTTETFDGTGTDALLLSESPVNSVGTVSVSDSDSPPTWSTAGTADYALDSKGVLFATDTAGTAIFGRTWPAGRQNVSVTYDYGYDTVPSDVRMVALSVASRLLVQGPAISETIGETAIRYAVASTDLTNGEVAILRKYKRSR